MASIPLNGTSLDTDTVRAIMLFPNDPIVRDYYLTVLRLSSQISTAEDNELMTVAAKDLKSLVSGVSWSEVESLAIEAAKGGTIAGDVLATIYIMDAFQGQHAPFVDPSLNKAIHVMEMFGAGRRFGDGEKMPRSETTIRKKWDKFESVAHLWAATRLNQDYPFCEQGAWLNSVEACHTMLAVAANILSFGTSYIPKRTKPAKPVVNPDNAWTIPEHIGSRKLESDRLPDQLMEYLESYRA